MTYHLGRHSRRELCGVDPALVAVVEHAIEITAQDFTVFDGTRTIEEQREMVARGASRTLRSKHLTGRAVDLVPWLNGQARWEWALIWPIALAMDEAAQALHVPLRWGGVWDRTLAEIDDSYEEAVSDYIHRRRVSGSGSVFVDGPHYELIG